MNHFKTGIFILADIVIPQFMSAKNVCIGTTDPEVKLNVAGDPTIKSTTTCFGSDLYALYTYAAFHIENAENSPEAIGGQITAAYGIEFMDGMALWLVETCSPQYLFE